MKFLANHPFLFAASILVGIATYGWLRRVSCPAFDENARLVKLILGFAAAALLLFGYIVPTVYYFPNNIGVLGDDYLHMATALEMKNYLKYTHLLYPYVAEETIAILLKVGLLSPQEPLFLEKAFAIGSWPVKAITLLALLLWLLWATRYFKSFVVGALAFFSAAVSYGFWMWGIDPNSIGMALAAEMLGGLALLYWIEKKTPAAAALAAFMNCLGVYIFNGYMFFILGAVVAVVVLNFFVLEMPRAIRIKNMATFAVVCTVLGAFFYGIEANLIGTWEPHNLFKNLAYTEYGLSGIGDPLRNPLKAVKDIIVSSIMHFTNLWQPEKPLDSLLIFLQLASLVGLLTSLLINWHATITLLKNPSVMLFTIISVVMFICFIVNRAGTHYSVITLPPNIMLFLLLVLGTQTVPREIFCRRVLLCSLIVSSFSFNVFSSANIFRGNDINQFPYYRENSAILSHLNLGESAVYLKNFSDGYDLMAMRTYYLSKFGRIEWRTPPATPKEIQSSGRTFIEKSYLDRFSPSDIPFTLELISPDIYEIKPT